MPRPDLSPNAVAKLAAAAASSNPVLSFVMVIDFPDIPLRLGDGPATGGNSWEEGRIVSIDEISRELPHPGGGGIGSVANATFRLLDIGDANSPSSLRLSLGFLLGVWVDIVRLYADDAFADGYLLFGGRIESVEIDRNIATIQCVSQDKAADLILPTVVTTREDFSDLPDTSLGVRLPNVFGGSTDVGPIPTVRVNRTTRTSLASSHLMKLMAVNWGVLPPGGTVVRGLTTDAIVSPDPVVPAVFSQAIQLSQNLTDLRPGFLNAGQSLSGQVNNVLNPEVFISPPPIPAPVGRAFFSTDQPHPDTGTGGLFDGWGFSSVTIALNLSDTHEGNNQVEMDIRDVGRTAPSDTQTFGQIFLQSLDANGTIINDAIRSLPNIRDIVSIDTGLGFDFREVVPFPISSQSNLQVLIQAFHSDDEGSATDLFQIFSLQVSTFFLPTSEDMVIFLNEWQGAIDPTGAITGVQFALLSNPLHVAHNALQAVLPIDIPTFTTAAASRSSRSLQGGIGQGWRRTQLSMSEFVSDIGLQFGVYFYPDNSGIFRARIADFSETLAFSFDETNIEGVQGRNGFEADLDFTDGRRSDLYSSIRIFWKYLPTIGQFAEETFVKPGECNHATPGIAAEFASQATQISELYETALPELIIEADYIYTKADSDLLLEQLMPEYVQSRRLVRLTSTLLSDGVQLADTCDIAMQELPDQKVYLVLARQDFPSRDRIEFTCIESSFQIVDFVRMWDGVSTRFLFFSTDALIISSTIPSGPNINVVDLFPGGDPVRAFHFVASGGGGDVAVPELGVAGLFSTGGGTDLFVTLSGTLTGLLSTATDPGGVQQLGSPIWRQDDGRRFEIFIDDEGDILTREVT